MATKRFVPRVIYHQEEQRRLQVGSYEHLDKSGPFELNFGL